MRQREQPSNETYTYDYAVTRALPGRVCRATARPYTRRYRYALLVPGNVSRQHLSRQKGTLEMNKEEAENVAHRIVKQWILEYNVSASYLACIQLEDMIALTLTHIELVKEDKAALATSNGTTDKVHCEVCGKDITPKLFPAHVKRLHKMSASEYYAKLGYAEDTQRIYETLFEKVGAT